MCASSWPYGPLSECSFLPSPLFIYFKRKDKKTKGNVQGGGFAWKIPSDKQQMNMAPSI